MTTPETKHSTTYTFTTCKRCSYIINADEELCQKCQDQTNTNLSLF